jgi:hypothetical protein
VLEDGSGWFLHKHPISHIQYIYYLGYTTIGWSLSLQLAPYNICSCESRSRNLFCRWNIWRPFHTFLTRLFIRPTNAVCPPRPPCTSRSPPSCATHNPPSGSSSTARRDGISGRVHTTRKQQHNHPPSTNDTGCILEGRFHAGATTPCPQKDRSVLVPLPHDGQRSLAW